MIVLPGPFVPRDLPLRGSALLIVVAFLAVACGGGENLSVSPASPTPPGLPAARERFCLDWRGAVDVIAQPIETVSGEEAAAGYEKIADVFRADAQAFTEAGWPGIAGQVTAFADALAAIADEVRPAAPTDPDARKRWEVAAAKRREVLTHATEAQVSALRTMCMKVFGGR